jgi:hypothetical protein
MLSSQPLLANECAYEAQEARITDQLALEPDRKYFVIEGEDLKRFTKNMNDIYNVGFADSNVDKIYIINQAHQPHNPHFQGVHMFVMKDHCVNYYTTTYMVIIQAMLKEDARKALGIAENQIKPLEDGKKELKELGIIQ